MSTPARPRQSAIPTPGRATGIPTPGSRSRSSSNVYQTNPPPSRTDDISRALADAIKANDPSHHRPIPLSASSSTASLSPQSVSYSGRRSVAGRPSSAASTSSLKVAERTKTPTSLRPVSRPASRQSDASTKPPRTFEVGDNVRIESLGYEGTLRYLGEIDGKPGLWAGVELSGGFAGKGKNNGSVAGKQYFSCPEKCGVFVATTKLSPPTVGPGSIQRPPSVASSHGGRATPAMSGRITPSFSTSRTPSASFSNGRVTPLTGGRVTPSTVGRTTPGTAISGRRTTFKTPVAKQSGASLSDKITAGSRASKYMGMTAQQLSSRDLDSGAESPTRKSSGQFATALSSPSLTRTLSSPSKPSGSPFSTPKAPSGRLSNVNGPSASPSLPSVRSRPTASTPRARIPSGVAMPPPPSPKQTQQQLQDPASGDDPSHRTSVRASSRPSSSTSFRSAGTDDLALVEQLQSRLDAVQYENERLRAAAEADSGIDPGQLRDLQLERQNATARAMELETRLAELEGMAQSRHDSLQDLQAENLNLANRLKDVTSEVEQLSVARDEEVQTLSTTLQTLQDQLHDTEHLIDQKDQVINALSLDIEELRNSTQKAHAELDEERTELGAQIDELRIAGQETIALYEERLSDAKSERYELEHRITNLESRLESASSGSDSQEQVAQRASSAAQIDNETLRDQVQHLQKRSAKLEDQLEEARAALERDVTTYQERIGRIRQEEEQRKKDLLAKSREVEQLLKSEASARVRVEEMEEALRESTVALENARGEVESLRAELANLDVLIDDSTEGDISSRLSSFIKRAASDRARYQKEINNLEELLQESRSKGSRDDNHKQVSDLTQLLEDRTNELENLRKKVNREAPLSNGVLDAKVEASTNREEVAGLKHIVQELQKENLAATQRIKLLESENHLLSSETEQLRQEVHILEDNMNNSLLDNDGLNEGASSNMNDIDGLRRQIKEQHIRFDNEMDQMRKKLNETEMKQARVVHDLNKEISELEALVESKIYREDELEQEAERLREKLSKHKKSSKNSGENTDNRHRLSTASTSTASSETFKKAEEVCEICERPGHDIFNCSLLKEDVKKDEVFCEDCEGAGHVAADCPHSLDVF